VVATTLFVLVFVLLGLGVVAAAMSSGPKAPSRGSGQASRGQRRALYTVATIVAVGAGIALPGAVIATNAANENGRAPGGVRLTSAEAEGRQVFAARCATCHILDGANAVGRVGPNLDELRPPRELTIDAIEKGRARGKGQMPAGLADGEDAENVADFIVKVAGR
jgi:mono/diheme cytochrome c family protein